MQLKGFKLKGIVDRLALDWLINLQNSLTQPLFNADQVVLSLLLTLNKKRYLNELLFRDFTVDRETLFYQWILPDGHCQKVHKESVFYLETILMRRLQLANNLGQTPTNLHLLFNAFLRHAPAWASVNIGRSKEKIAYCDRPFFQKMAQRLTHHCQQLGENMSEISKRRKEDYGPIWLQLTPCYAEVPEELNLLEVLQLLPVPLDPDFVDDPNLQQLFVRVLDALNERYALLRACGLPPEKWLEREKPSINNLKDLRQLRKTAEAQLAQGEKDTKTAYQQAFHRLQAGQKKWAGFIHFDELIASEIGQALLGYPMISVEQLIETGEEDKLSPEVTATGTDQIEFYEAIQILINNVLDLFEADQVMLYFFREVLGRAQPFPPPTPEFKILIAANPQYADLSDEDLRVVLCEKAETIARKATKTLK